MIAIDSHKTKSPSLIEGTRPLGLMPRYAGAFHTGSKCPCGSLWNWRPSSRNVHSTHHVLDTSTLPKSVRLEPILFSEGHSWKVEARFGKYLSRIAPSVQTHSESTGTRSSLARMAFARSAGGPRTPALTRARNGHTDRLQETPSATTDRTGTGKTGPHGEGSRDFACRFCAPSRPS